MSEHDTPATEPETSPEPPLPAEGQLERRLTVLFWAMAIALGALHHGAARHMMNPDGISYLEVGEAYLRGDWDLAINSYWSPLYSWLLGIGLWVMRPSPYWEFAAVHVVNFLVYVAALCSFHFFLAQVICYSRSLDTSDGEYAVLPRWAWIMLGYPLFMWTSLCLMVTPCLGQRIVPVTPDMLVAAFVYLAAGLVLRIRMDESRWRTFVGLGVVLGLGYLAKAPMFVLGLIFLAVAFFVVRSKRRAVLRVLVALALMLLIGGPHILAISKRMGKLTFGESKTLAYAWLVNGVERNIHWQGGPSGHGTPTHPTRQVLDRPPVFEFGTPVGGTYPPWYDPAYWYEGLKPRFSLIGHLRCLKVSAKTYFEVFSSPQSCLFMLFLVLCALSGRRWRLVKDLAANWVLLVPGLAALGMYSLILVRARYVGAFLVIVWAGAFLGVRLRDRDVARGILGPMVGSLLVVMLMSLAFPAMQWTFRVASDVPKMSSRSDHPHWQVAKALHEAGIEEGDRVASIGWTFGAFWARLARVRVVAEIPVDGAPCFWSAEPAVKAGAMRAFADAGAKGVVSDRVPQPFIPAGWISAGHPSYHYYALSDASAREQSPGVEPR